MAKTKGKTLTRTDVLRLIEEHGGKSVGLDLSGKQFEEGVDLRKLNLSGIILEEANLPGAHFEGANLLGAHLEGADLSFAHFEGAELFFTYLDGADLWFAEFSPDSKLEGIHWGNYILAGEKDKCFPAAAITYRRLKQWHTSAGMYDIAGEFFFREMTVKRKTLKWWPNPLPRAWSKFLSILCGYGEKWHRVIISAAVLVFGLAAIYFFLGAFSPGTFPGCLYYSVASFTALGYGSWVYPEPESWAKGLGAVEAALGIFMMALFLITFVRKMTR